VVRLVDTPALIGALKSGQLGYLGLDVYEEEAQLFFEDRSDLPLQDDVLARLLTFPNVVITAHQAFLTRVALGAIAQTTLDNIAAWAAGEPNGHHLINRSDCDCVFIAIGAGDRGAGGVYADIDMTFGNAGYFRKAGAPYPTERIK